MKAEGGYPGKTGFGHEEWNFQSADAYKGFIFGFWRYEPSPKMLQELSGRQFKIVFWAREPKTHEKLIVGVYEAAVLADDSDAAQLDKHFKKHGIYIRRAAELARVPAFPPNKAQNEIVESVKRGRFNVKCKADRVKLVLPTIPIPKAVARRLGQYFGRPTKFDRMPHAIDRLFARKRRHLVQPDRNPPGTTTLPIEDSYLRATRATLKRIIPRHKKLASLFMKWLSKKRYQNIRKEVRYVDIEFCDATDLYRAELKTCYGLTTTKAIREALGQLLDYNLSSYRPKAKKWLLVLDEKPSDEDLIFLKNVAAFGLPISIYWLSGTNFEPCDLTNG